MRPNKRHLTRFLPSRPRLNRWDAGVLLLVMTLLGLLFQRIDTHFSYPWDWNSVWPYLYRYDTSKERWVANLLIEGLECTLRMAFWGMILAALIGVLAGVARNSRSLFCRLVSATYVHLIRNMPPVVFVFIFIYFIASQCLPQLDLAHRVESLSHPSQQIIERLFSSSEKIENFFLGVVCLSVYSGAYMTEIVRAGLESIPRSQWEAGKSLGLGQWQTLRLIVAPQAFRHVLPALTGQFIQLIKDSSLVSLVSIQELTFMAQDIQVSTQRIFEVFILVAGIYFVLCFCLSWGFELINQKFFQPYDRQKRKTP